MKRSMIAVVGVMAVLLVAGAAQAATWNVSPGQSIQTAVNSAASGDTIYINAGNYTEQVSLTGGKNLTFAGAGSDLVMWSAPAGSSCLVSSLDSYSGAMAYEISGFTFNVRSEATAAHGTGIKITGAKNGPLALSIHDNRFVEDRASGDDDHWGTSMWLCHNRYAARDGSGNAAVSIHDNIDQTWGGLTMSNSQAYDIYNNLFDGCSNAIYNGHGCPDQVGQTFGYHHIYGNIFQNASDSLHPGSLTPAIDWEYYGAGGATHLASLIEENLFYTNDTAIRFVEDTDMTYPDHIVTANNFIVNGMAVMVVGDNPSILNAHGNWWGAADGPGPVGPGSGDPITTYVDYGAFATEPIAGVPVPEPATMALLALGGVGTLLRRRRGYGG